MNAFLRFSVVAITIAASSVHAGTVGTFIPAEPSIESPNDNALAVSQTPRFESSLPEAQLSGSDIGVNVSQTQTDWLLYTPDEEVILFGGAESSSEPGIIASGSTKTVRLPYSISVHDDDISIMTVSQAGDITFKSDEGIILAAMSARIDKSYYTESSNSHSLAVIKITPMLITVQWYHKSVDSAPTAWQSDIQAYITRLGTFGLRLSEHDVNHGIFNLTTGYVGCHLRNSDSTFMGRFESLSYWKTSPLVNNNKFSLVCVSQDIINHSVTVTSFEDPAPVFFDLPEFTVLSSSEIDFQLTNDQKLEANTLYALQAKHYVKETSDVSASPIINTSAFGEAISFTTEAADLELQVAISNSLSFVVNQAKDFTMTITNNNSEATNPTAQIILPFDFLQGFNGSLSDFFSASIDGGNCAVGLDGGQTTLSCIVLGLAPGASATLRAKATMPNTNITQIQYKVCETAFCSSKTATSVPVTVTTGSNSNDDSSTAEGSSGGSGGGSLLWIFAALPLLRRRGA